MRWLNLSFFYEFEDEFLIFYNFCESVILDVLLSLKYGDLTKSGYLF
jgi:hypothetical protein